MKKKILASGIVFVLLSSPALANDLTTTGTGALKDQAVCRDTAQAMTGVKNQFLGVSKGIIKASKPPVIDLAGIADACLSGLANIGLMPSLMLNLCGAAYNYVMATALGTEIQQAQASLSNGMSLPYGGGGANVSATGGLSPGAGNGAGQINLNGGGTTNYSSQTGGTYSGTYSSQATGTNGQNLIPGGGSGSTQGNSSFGDILNKMFK